MTAGSLPSTCCVCGDPIGPEKPSTLQICSCLIVQCQDCAKLRIADNVGTYRSGLPCLACGERTPPSPAFEQDLKMVEECENYLLSRAFEYFKLNLLWRSSENVDKYCPLLEKYVSISVGDDSLLEDMMSYTDVDRVKLLISRLECLRGGYPKGASGIEDDAGDGLPWGPLYFVRFPKNCTLERILQNIAEEWRCGVCMDDLQVGQVPLINCECAFWTCTTCCLQTTLNNVTGYLEGPSCPICRNTSPVTFLSIYAAQEEEKTLLNKIITNKSVGRKYRVNNAKDMRELCLNLHSVQCTSYGDLERYKCQLEQMRLPQLTLEAVRHDLRAAGLKGLDAELGPMRLIKVRKNAFADVVLQCVYGRTTVPTPGPAKAYDQPATAAALAPLGLADLDLTAQSFDEVSSALQLFETVTRYSTLDELSREHTGADIVLRHQQQVKELTSALSHTSITADNAPTITPEMAAERIQKLYRTKRTMCCLCCFDPKSVHYLRLHLRSQHEGQARAITQLQGLPSDDLGQDVPLSEYSTTKEVLPAKKDSRSVREAAVTPRVRSLSSAVVAVEILSSSEEEAEEEAEQEEDDDEENDAEDIVIVRRRYPISGSAPSSSVPSSSSRAGASKSSTASSAQSAQSDARREPETVRSTKLIPQNVMRSNKPSEPTVGAGPTAAGVPSVPSNARQDSSWDSNGKPKPLVLGDPALSSAQANAVRSPLQTSSNAKALTARLRPPAPVDSTTRHMVNSTLLSSFTAAVGPTTQQSRPQVAQMQPPPQPNFRIKKKAEAAEASDEEVEIVDQPSSSQLANQRSRPAEQVIPAVAPSAPLPNRANAPSAPSSLVAMYGDSMMARSMGFSSTPYSSSLPSSSTPAPQLLAPLPVAPFPPSAFLDPMTMSVSFPMAPPPPLPPLPSLPPHQPVTPAVPVPAPPEPIVIASPLPRPSPPVYTYIYRPPVPLPMPAPVPQYFPRPWTALDAPMPPYFSQPPLPSSLTPQDRSGDAKVFRSESSEALVPLDGKPAEPEQRASREALQRLLAPLQQRLTQQHLQDQELQQAHSALTYVYKEIDISHHILYFQNYRFQGIYEVVLPCRSADDDLAAPQMGDYALSLKLSLLPSDEKLYRQQAQAPDSTPLPVDYVDGGLSFSGKVQLFSNMFPVVVLRRALETQWGFTAVITAYCAEDGKSLQSKKSFAALRVAHDQPLLIRPYSPNRIYNAALTSPTTAAGANYRATMKPHRGVRVFQRKKAHRPSQLETFKEYQKLRLQQMRESQPQAGDADEVAGAVDEGSAEVELGEVVGSASGPVDVVATHLSTALPLPATLPAITSTDEATAIAEISATASTSESTASVSQPPPKVPSIYLENKVVPNSYSIPAKSIDPRAAPRTAPASNLSYEEQRLLLSSDESSDDDAPRKARPAESVGWHISTRRSMDVDIASAAPKRPRYDVHHYVDSEDQMPIAPAAGYRGHYGGSSSNSGFNRPTAPSQSTHNDWRSRPHGDQDRFRDRRDPRTNTSWRR